MWLNELCKRWMGRTSRRTRRRFSRQRSYVRPRLEKLEDRTLLSAPGGGTVATIATLSATTGQFGGGTSNTQSGSQFIGGNFNVNGGFGSFSHGWGAGGSVSMTGHVGVDASYDVTGGQVSATYNNISLNQSFVQPTGIGQQVNFTPGNNYVSYGNGTFSTTSPQAGAGIALDAGVNGSISGSLELAGSTVFGGSTSFGGSVNQSLISYDTVNGLEVGGKPISSFLSGSNSGGNVSGSLTLSGGLSIPLVGPLFLNLGVSANPSLTGLSESLDLSAGPKNGKIDGGINLGSASEQLPSLTLGSSSLQNGGVLTDSGGSTFASANTQMGALIGGIVDTDTIDLGPFSLSLTPVSFTMNPKFSFVQTGTITPYNKLTYDFSSPVVVTLDGQVQNGGIAESSVTFTPGVDSVSFQFEGNPITVTPHWTTGLDYTNEIDLDYTLQAVLNALELQGSASLGPVSGNFTLGPLYTKTFNLANATLATVYDNTFSIASQTDNNLPSFTISAPVSTLVTTTHDGTTTYNPNPPGGGPPIPGTLREAVLSANFLASSGKATGAQTIQLGAGTYTLTIAPNGNGIGVGGALYVTAPSLTIEGAGAGQTFIKAAPSLNDRVFIVTRGANLTLQGVTIEGGNATYGGYAGNGSFGGQGGGIWSSGTLKLKGDTIRSNEAQGIATEAGFGAGAAYGGGLYVAGGSVTLSNDTFSNNKALGHNGYTGPNGTYGITANGGPETGGNGHGGGGGGNAYGGGLYVAGGSVSLIGDTFSANTVQGGGGGTGGTGGAGGNGVNGGNGISAFAGSGGAGGAGGKGGTGGTGGTGGSAFGGGLYVAGGSLILMNDTLSGNTAQGGAGGAGGTGGKGGNGGNGGSNYTGPLGVHYGNGGKGGNGGSGGNGGNGGLGGNGDGGGLVVGAGSAKLINDTISGNQANGGGGALFGDGGGAGNAGSGGSGASSGSGGKTGSTGTASNGGNAYGGGLLSFGTTTLANTLIAGNASTGGPGVSLFIFSLSSPGVGYGPDVYGTVSSLGHNLIGKTADSTGWDASSDLLNVSGDLEALGNYGGPTQTMLPELGSPAINGGTSNVSGLPSTDQRGYKRVVGSAVDIGAVEYQFDLDLTGYIAAGGNPGTVQYNYTVTNNGPDPAGEIPDLTVTLPTGINFSSLSAPSGWSASNPGAGNSGAVTFIYAGNLSSGQSASFTIDASVKDTTLGNSLTTTASVGPGAGPNLDNDLSNNSVNLTFTNEQEGQTFDKVQLFHFTDPNASATANSFTAAVNWGDNSNNTSNDGSGTVSVVADLNGGFDILGSHTYAEEGMNPVVVSVNGLDGTNLSSGANNLFNVVDAPLFSKPSDLTPPSNATINGAISSPTLTNAVLYHFTDAGATASDFTATVNWGDGNSNTSSDGSGAVSVVADPLGGFNVVGVSHTYTAPGSFAISVSVLGTDGTKYNQPSAFTFNNGALLFHFTDANPNAAASDFTADVNWGDGNSTTSSDGTGNVFVVANPSGGFDVYGLHTYDLTQPLTSATFSVTVNDDGGARTHQDTTFQVLNPDQPLTPVKNSLYSPTVSKEGDSISSNQLLFQFTDPDTNAQAKDYQAFVSWGDGSFNNSGDGTGSVSVQQISSSANSILFGVYGSHTYSEGSGYFAVKVTDLGDPASLDAGGQVTGSSSLTPLTITDPAVSVTASTTPFSASEGSMSTVQTLATFTDPGGPESDNNAYIAIIQWGDGSVTATDLATQANYTQASVNSQGQIIQNTGNVITANNVPGIVLGSDGQTFSVNLAHQYTEEGTYNITVLINHDGTLSQEKTITANVSDPAVLVTASTTPFSASEGSTSTVQTLATFTDPGGPEYFVPQLSISTTSNSFGALAAGTYYYTVTSITASGESTASNEVSATTTGGTSVVQLNWNQVTGATGYKIYRGTSPGAEDTLIASPTSGSDLQFLDEGSQATSAASPPTNTSADYPLSDPNPYVATIQWGDGNSSTATVANGGIVLGSDGQTFSVNLAHLYADEGAYNITVTLNHNGVQSDPVTITANVADSDNLTGTGATPLTSTYGAGLTNVTLATFTDTYTGNSASDFSASINWGDGQTSSGTVSGSNGNFTVTGSHNYANANTSANPSYDIVVTLTDDGAGTATATASTTVTINQANISYSIGNVTQAYGYPANLAADLPSSFPTGINGETLDITYSSSGDTATATPGTYAINGVVSNGTGLLSNYNLTLTPGTLTVLGTGVYTAGNVLWIVGGHTSNDRIDVDPAGCSRTGSTGISVDATLNHIHTSTTYHQAFTAINILLYAGNDNVSVARSLTINTTVSAGNGRDHVYLDDGNNMVTLGDGKDDVHAGDGANTIIAGNGKDKIHLGDGNNTVTLGNGNDNVHLGDGSNMVTAGDGNDNVQLGNPRSFCHHNPPPGTNVVTLGNGNDNVQVGDGNNMVTLGDGKDHVQAGEGNNFVTLGNGNDEVHLGDGANTVTVGNGNDHINVGDGNGNNLIVAGLGRHTVDVGCGSNILIDGSVQLTQNGDSLRQVLDDWIEHGAQASNVASIRSRLSVTYNTHYDNRLHAGSGLDWFWATDTKDHLNIKKTDLLN